ncbi:MAG TPA: response regulator transcription factor [Rubrobacteraceae bacterium]|nr:response regulator transcription factor [Rubrobacteraceae bacterium]
MINGQSALYAFVLGVACLFLVPLTSLWWIVPVLGTVLPLALAVLQRPNLWSGRPHDRKARERELLEALAKRSELTSTAVAMCTSLTVDEASQMLEELSGKGHLELHAEDEVVTYALRDRSPGRISGSFEPGCETGDALGDAPKRLDEPLSERELEVLNLLASGRTNSEVARDLFVSVGTVKSHTGNIYRKLGARNRAEAVARARENRLLP